MMTMKQTDTLTVILLFLIVFPVICIYFDLYQSVYYVVYSAVCRYWYQLRWNGGGRSHIDDYSVRLMKELFAENSVRVKDAELVVKNLSVVKGTEYGAWMMEGSGRRYKSDSSLLDSRDLNDDVTDETTTKVRVALVIISCRRETVYENGHAFQPRYLIQNVASLAPLLSERWKNIATARVTFSLSICSVSEGDLTAEEDYLSQLFTVVRFHSVSRTTFAPSHDVMAWAYEKEKRDYVHCLRHSASIKDVDYVVLLEDDAIARSEALDVIERLVLRREEQINNRHSDNNNQITDFYNNRKGRRFHYKSNVNYNAVRERKITTDSYKEPEENCYYVKLYHPSRLLGYLSLERERIPHLLAIAVILGTVFYCCNYWLRKSNLSVLARGRVQNSEHFRKGDFVVDRSGLWGYCRRHFLFTYMSFRRYLYCLYPDDQSPSTMSISHYRWLQTCCVCGLAALLIGRPHMDDAWRRLISPHLHYTVPNVHCCSQASLYSRHAALQLSDYLHRVRCNDTWHKDDAIWAWSHGGSNEGNTFEGQAASTPDDYVLNRKELLHSGASSDDYFSDLKDASVKNDTRVKIVSVDGHLCQPNIFKHIGFWSSLRKGFIDPRLMRE